MQTEKFKKSRVQIYSYSILAICCLVTSLITYVLFGTTRDILDQNLKDKLSALANSASLQFQPNELSIIQDASIIGQPAYSRIVTQLQNIKSVDSNIKFVYLLRPSKDPDIFTFIADADSLDPSKIADYNGNGVIDEGDELSWPGDEYNVSEIPALRDEAIIFPTTDDEPTIDQWGVLMSAYAPIRDRGTLVGILGMDVEVSNYLNQINKTLIPFAFFVVFLLLNLSILTAFLVRIWRTQVNLVEELDRQKDELLSIVSHQLATPTTAIRWQMEMMLDGDVGTLTKEQHDHIESTHKVTTNLVELIQMILDVSRIQLGKMKVEKQDLDLNEFFKDLINVIQPKALEKKTNFKVSIPDKLPVAKLDKRLTNMTLENLLSNAVKYTPSEGEVDFTVTLEGDRMKIVVRDTGVGIPEKDQKQIFGKLYRASNVRNTVDGNGFGLYVAKGAVEGQGGTIRFESTEGKGTTFFVELPLK